MSSRSAKADLTGSLALANMLVREQRCARTPVVSAIGAVWNSLMTLCCIEYGNRAQGLVAMPRGQYTRHDLDFVARTWQRVYRAMG